MTPEELNFHIEECIKQLSSLLNEWSKSGTDTLSGKAQKVAYWVREYAAFLRREDTFSPKSVPRLKRGNVVVVDFGFRVGKEFGGRHFAVVIDNNNAYNSEIVTVVPLFSLKPEYKPNQYTCVLEDGIYTPMIDQANAIIDEAEKIIRECAEKVEERGTPEYRAKEAVAKDLLKRAKRMIEEIEHMKEGSVANTCQVLTISKMRIKRPLKKEDPLYGLRLSTGDMERINKQLSSLIIFPPPKEENKQEK